MLRKRLQYICCIAVALVLIYSACSNSTGPDSNNNGNDNDIVADIPSIPKPAAPGAETGTYSDTVTVISSLETSYRPIVTAAFLNNVSIQSRCGLHGTFDTYWSYSSWVSQPEKQSIWSNEAEFTIPNSYIFNPSYGRYSKWPMNPPKLSPVNLSGHTPWNRILLVENGDILPPQSGEGEITSIWNGPLTSILEVIQCQFGYTFGEPLSSKPFLRRDRFWVRRPLEGGIGNFMLLTGNTQGQITTSYTSGTSTTETETFGKSVTASVDLSLNDLSLGIQTTFSQTFSTAVTVLEESSESFVKTVSGESGKTIHFQVWELMERYTITDSTGEPFTDPNYLFETDELHIRGVAVALEATEFNQR